MKHLTNGWSGIIRTVQIQTSKVVDIQGMKRCERRSPSVMDGSPSTQLRPFRSLFHKALICFLGH